MLLDYPHGGCFIDVIYLLPLCDSRLNFYLPLRMQMLVLYAMTRCTLYHCCCCLSRSCGSRLPSAMTRDTKILLAPSQRCRLKYRSRSDPRGSLAAEEKVRR